MAYYQTCFYADHSHKFYVHEWTPFKKEDYGYDQQCSYDNCNVLHLWTDTDLEDCSRWTGKNISNEQNKIYVVNSKYITHVTLPFFYWKSVAPELGINDYGRPFLLKPKPDLTGRIVIQLHMSNMSNWKNIQFATEKLIKLLKDREVNYGWIFKSVIPFSTRTGVDAFKSFIPISLKTHQSLKNARINEEVIVYPTPVESFCAIISDVVTLPLKLISFFPRLIYQQCCKKNLDDEFLNNIKVDVQSGNPKDFSWTQGVLSIDVIARIHYKQRAIYTSNSIKVTSAETEILKGRHTFILGV